MHEGRAKGARRCHRPIIRETAMRIMLTMGTLVLGLGVLAFAVQGALASKEEKKGGTRVFELRTYTAKPGKMKALHARFKDHTNKLVWTIA
jgi:hypothetical protein